MNTQTTLRLLWLFVLLFLLAFGFPLARKVSGDTTHCDIQQCVQIGFSPDNSGFNTVCFLSQNAYGPYTGRSYNQTFGAANSYGTNSKGGMPIGTSVNG